MLIRGFLTVLALVGSCACSDKGLSKSGRYCFELPKTTLIGDLYVRKPRPESGDLLLNRRVVAEVLKRFFIDEPNRPGVIRTDVQVYSYDHEKNTLTLVEPSRWKEAKGVVTDFGSPRVFAPGVNVNTYNYRVVMITKGGERRERRVIPTKGRWAMRINVSLTPRLMAVLTRDTEPKKGMKEPSAHYVELFTYPEGKPVGEPYELPFTDFNNIEPMCWSSGNTHLVVSTEDGKHICIIEVPDLKEE